MEVFPVLALGFFLGMRHATDSDHVVAVTTIVTREKSVRSASMVGAMWGVGHSAAILALGGAIVLFGVVMPPRVGLFLELAAALMLVLLGVYNLAQARRAHRPSAVADRDQPEGREAQSSAARRGGGGLRPLLLGLVHGLAGSAAVALVVLTTIHPPIWGFVYLVLFGVGTLAGMMLITSAMALPLAVAARKVSSWSGYIGVVAGLFSLVFGLFLTYQVGFVDGLFRAELHLAPE
jgi:high-affinity nickel-transport protein